MIARSQNKKAERQWAYSAAPIPRPRGDVRQAAASDALWCRRNDDGGAVSYHWRHRGIDAWSRALRRRLSWGGKWGAF
jgi:hypothetical protein